MSSAERCRAAERLLRKHGLAEVRVTAEGHRNEVAAVSAPPDVVGTLVELAPAIKALGFRYVALALGEESEAPVFGEEPETPAAGDAPG